MQGWDGKGLVSTEWLAEHLADPSLRVFDGTMNILTSKSGPPTIESGYADYQAARIPGAAFLDLARDFSDHSSGLNFTMPSLAAFASALGAAGVSPDARIVIYSSTTAMWATRFWWMLRASGFDNAAILDGGLAKWRSEGRPVETSIATYPPTVITLKARPEMWAEKAEVLASICNGNICTINALPARMHEGEDVAYQARTGRIAGSRNMPFNRYFDTQGLMRSDAELRALLDQVGAFRSKRVICYCGGGIAATTTALALVRLGHPSVAVYDGSMAEWSRDPAMPMETGRNIDHAIENTRKILEPSITPPSSGRV